jgi:glycine cleavage system transcriptional repressor
MKNWFMLALVGQDQVGIVANITNTLYRGGCNLGETSMLRLGESFTMMMMVNTQLDENTLISMIKPTADVLNLHLHIDQIIGALHPHPEPDVKIVVHGADRAGIVAQVTGKLAQAGLNILDLETGVGGSSEKPFYFMQIEGCATQGMNALQRALEELKENLQGNIEINLSPLETFDL